MKLTLLNPKVSLLISFLVPAMGLLAQEPSGPGPQPSPGRQGPGAGPGGKEAHSPLEKEMETINRDMRKLGRQYSDLAQKASSLELVAEMQKSTETAKGLVPPQAEKKAEAEKATYMELYKKDMEALSTELAALKSSIDADDMAKSKAGLDKINQLKMSSHKELGVKMGGGEGRGGGGRRMGPPPGAGPEGKPPQQSPSSPPQ